MPAEPELITNGPPRPLAEVRADTGFAWSCRQGRVENGQLTEVHQITSADRDEYQRHMRGHGLKPLQSTYQRWKPWAPPRPARQHSPKPTDPGQRVEWVTVTPAHHENPGHLAADGTYVPASGTWIEETRQARTGVIWSVADTASAWWVQPDDDPAHPVYVKRAGKHWRDRDYGEGTLYEVPGTADAARANIARGEIVRQRGIFPVIAVVFKDSGREQTYVDWHCDPQCPRAAGRDRYDRVRHGPAYGYTTSDGTTWTPLHVAQALTDSGQPPSCLCPDCIVNLDPAPPPTPAAPPPPEADPAPSPAADPSPSAAPSAAAPGGAARARFAVCLTPPATDAEFIQSCARLASVLASLAAQTGGWADSMAALGFPQPVLDPLRQASEGLTTARGAAARAARALEEEFTGTRDVAARGLRFTGQDTA